MNQIRSEVTRQIAVVGTLENRDVGRFAGLQRTGAGGAAKRMRSVDGSAGNGFPRA